MCMCMRTSLGELPLIKGAVPHASDPPTVGEI